LLPMQAMHHAKQAGKGDEVRDAFYAAYWEEGLDIGQMEAIRQVTEGCGLEWGPLSEALAESKHLSSVLAEYQEGLDLGFDGIPAFVFGDMKFTGAQPMAMFRRLAERASAMLGEDANAFARERRVL
ncbi:MAG: DsbA family protein, partial [Rhodothermales bacterium]